jgi:hypothetical protein
MAKENIIMSTIRNKRSSIPGKVPTVQQLEYGELAINTHDGIIYTKVNDGSEIGERVVDLTLRSNAKIQTYEFTVTDEETSFTIDGGYAAESLTVFYNGILLQQSEFTATNKSTVNLNFSTNNGDQITVLKPVNIVIDELDSYIDDNMTDDLSTWSSQKIHEDLTGKQNRCGFPLGTDKNHFVNLFYNESTRTITIEPKSGQSDFVFYVNGKEFRKTASDSIQHGNEYGGNFIYYDINGNLVSTKTPWNMYITAPVAYVYWDDVNSRGIPMLELHTADRNVALHERLHFVDGTQVISGFAISGYTLNNGSTNDAATFGIASGRIADEDLFSDIATLPNNGPYTLLERSGANGKWAINRSQTLPYIFNGNRLQYNILTNSFDDTWGRANVTEDHFINMWIFVVPALPGWDQFIIIPGQNEYSTLGAAETESISSISFGSMPFQEIAPLYQLTIRYNANNPAAFTNTLRSAIVAVKRLVGSKAIINAVTQTNDPSTFINDDTIETTKTWSSNKINTEFGSKVSLAGNKTIDGIVTLSDTTDTNAAGTSGSLLVNGGIGIQKSLYVHKDVIGPVTRQTSGSFSIAHTNSFLIHSFHRNEYRSGNYTLSAFRSGSSSVYMCNVMVIHNGSNVYFSENNVVHNDGDLFTLSVAMNGNDVELRAVMNSDSETTLIWSCMELGV